MLNIILVSLFSDLISSVSSAPKLILISLDGFRYDGIDARSTPNMYKWAKDGAWFTNGVKPQYPTVSAVNHMSIATGLYTESHGIVSNKFYDRSSEKLFQYWNDAKTSIIDMSDDESWFKGEPIWITNQKNTQDEQRNSACLYWPFCEVKFPNAMPPLVYRKWEGNRTYNDWMDDVDEIVNLFQRSENPVNFIAWYIREPDRTLHDNGFFNGKYKKILNRLDSLFGYFVKAMEEAKLDQEVNVILTSDHGHAQVSRAKNVICIQDFVELNKLRNGDLMIYTLNDGNADEVYGKLTSAIETNDYKVKVYKKQGFPKKWHYKGLSSRIGDVILEPEVGWDVRFDCTREHLEVYRRENRYDSAAHGMSPDAPEMHAVLVLHGPSIRSNQQINRIPQNIDLYALMCHLLEIEPAPNNGSLSFFENNVDFVHSKEKYVGGFIIIVVPLIGLVLMIVIYAMTHCFKGNCTSPRATEEKHRRHSDESYRESIKESTGESATADRSRSQ